MDNNSILINIAEDDLHASRLLYDEDLFPQALYYLQQSIEKCSKHIAITCNLYEINELQSKVSHNTLKVYRKALSKFLSPIETFLYPNNEPNQHLKTFDTLIYQIKNAEETEIVDTVVEEIKKTISMDDFHELNELKNIASDSERLIEFYTALGEDDEFIHNLKKQLKNPDFEQFFIDRFDKLFELLPYYIKSIIIIFFLSILTYKLNDKTRYPVEKNFINPADIYTLENSLIKNYLFFEKTAKTCIQSIVVYDNYINNIF